MNLKHPGTRPDTPCPRLLSLATAMAPPPTAAAPAPPPMIVVVLAENNLLQASAAKRTPERVTAAASATPPTTATSPLASSLSYLVPHRVEITMPASMRARDRRAEVCGASASAAQTQAAKDQAAA